MQFFDLRKAITIFLVLATATSVLALAFSTFLEGGRGISGPAVPGDAQDQSQPSISKGAFVEPLSDVSSSQSSFVAADDGLPQIEPTNNLTDLVASGIAREMVKSNPDGPQSDQSGLLSMSLPDSTSTEVALRAAVASGKLQKPVNDDWSKEAYGKTFPIIKNPTPSDVEAYLRTLGEAANGNLSEQTVSGVLASDLTPESAVALKGAIDKTILDLQKIRVPENLKPLHESILAVLVYQSHGLGLYEEQEDPFRASVDLENNAPGGEKALALLEKEIQNAKSLSLLPTSGGSLADNINSILGINKAYAWGIVFDPAVFANIGHQIWEYVKTNWKIWALEVLKNRLIHTIMVQTTNWINGGGTPQFVTNWKNFMKDAGNTAAGDLIAKIAPRFCSGIGPLIRINLEQTYMAPVPVGCTLDQVTANLRAFYNDFTQGSWVSYGAAILPSGNYFGSLFEGSQIAAVEAEAAKAAQKSQAESAQGFLSTEYCTTYEVVSDYDLCMQDGAEQCLAVFPDNNEDYDGCMETVQESCADESHASRRQCTEKAIGTPGKAIGATLDNALGAPIHKIVNSQDVIGLVSAVANSLLTKLLSSARGLVGTRLAATISGQEPDPWGLQLSSSTIQQNAQGEYNNVTNGNDGEPTPPQPPMCGMGMTGNYVGNLRAALDSVILENPDGIADEPNDLEHNAIFLDLVVNKLTSSGFSATTDVLNGNGNPSGGADLIAVWKAGDASMERYDAINGNPSTLRNSTQTLLVGDIPLDCVVGNSVSSGHCSDPCVGTPTPTPTSTPTSTATSTATTTTCNVPTVTFPPEKYPIYEVLPGWNGNLANRPEDNTWLIVSTWAGAVVGRIVDNSGAPQSEQFDIQPSVDNDNHLSSGPRIVYDPDIDKYLVVYGYAVTKSAGELRAQFVNPDGTLSGERFVMNPDRLGQAVYIYNPTDLKYDSKNKRFLVSWEGRSPIINSYLSYYDMTTHTAHTVDIATQYEDVAIRYGVPIVTVNEDKNEYCVMIGKEDDNVGTLEVFLERIDPITWTVSEKKLISEPGEWAGNGGLVYNSRDKYYFATWINIHANQTEGRFFSDCGSTPSGNIFTFAAGGKLGYNPISDTFGLISQDQETASNIFVALKADGTKLTSYQVFNDSPKVKRDMEACKEIIGGGNFAPDLAPNLTNGTFGLVSSMDYAHYRFQPDGGKDVLMTH